MTPIQLFNENTNLVYGIYNEKFSSYSELKDDAIQVGLLALWKACNKFDPNRGTKLSTYAYSSIENDMKCFLVRNTKKTACLVQLSATVGQTDYTYEELIPCPVNFVESVEIEELFDKLFEALGEQEKQVVKAVTDGYKKKEISDLLGVSKARICKILKDFRKQLQNTLLLSN